MKVTPTLVSYLEYCIQDAHNTIADILDSGADQYTAARLIDQMNVIIADTKLYLEQSKDLDVRSSFTILMDLLEAAPCHERMAYLEYLKETTHG